MTTGIEFEVREVPWQAAAETLRAIRRQVFVEEQGVPEELEWDGLDPDCRHVLAVDANGEALGTGRLLPDGHIGRMAVLQPWRRAGVGTALLDRLVRMADARGDRVLELSAQCYVIGFYRRGGFETLGSRYLEAGIPHVRMRRRLRD